MRITRSLWSSPCLQGDDTDPAAVNEIREAVRNGSEASVRLLNYKKSGKPFWNMFTLAPMADVDGNLRFIIGVQVCRLGLSTATHHAELVAFCCVSKMHTSNGLQWIVVSAPTIIEKQFVILSVMTADTEQLSGFTAVQKWSR